MKDEKIFVIDGTAVFYRAFHALPPFANSAGLTTNAVYGFLQSIRKLTKEYEPEYICVAFDVKGPTVRHEKYEDYKATRDPMPESLVEQLPSVKRLVKAMSIALLEKSGYEADDLIAGVVKKAREAGLKPVIVSSDKDLYQLIDGVTVVLDHAKNKEYGPLEVREKFGVEPAQIRDLLALAGDSSDNIPGVPGVGLKTAAKLLVEFGSIDGIYENIGEVSGKKLKEKLTENKELALLSRELTTLHTDVGMDLAVEGFLTSEPNLELLEPFLREMEFTKLYAEMIPAKAPAEAGQDYTAITNLKELKGYVGQLSSLAAFSIYMLFNEKGSADDLLAIYINPAKECEVASALIQVEALGLSVGLNAGEVASALKGVMEDAVPLKMSDDVKALSLYFLRMGVEVKGISFDTSLASYLLNPQINNHTVDNVAMLYLETILKEVKPPYFKLDEAGRSLFLSLRAPLIEGATVELKERLKKEGLTKLYDDMELPLAGVLALMEYYGIEVDGKVLKKLSGELALELEKLEGEIYQIAGEEFNINSPKQLSHLLFEKMGIEPVKKTKTGFSTDESVLTVLAEEYELPSLILNFRTLAKLKSTYVDAISVLICEDTGRVHTSFNQTVAATGRLSSSKPNLQNIPVRDDYSSRIREAFVAAKGFNFLSADYSQIELRILAHMSGDEELIKSFKNEEDIHAVTASEVFGIMPGLVTKEMRRRAKAINFGIVYGMGAYGLATDLGISVADAAEYIDNYFAFYGNVKRFIDKTIKEAEKKGFTTTLLGRKRPIPELQSRSNQTRKFGERIAVNSPIQGTAADMIKVAMINIHERLERLRASGMKSRMILQIHDELFFEVPDVEMDEVSELVREEMEGALKLKVPVKVNLKQGKNWAEVE